MKQWELIESCILNFNHQMSIEEHRVKETQ